MLKEENEGRTRTILLNNKLEKNIPFYIYEKLEVGDSIYKNQNLILNFTSKKTEKLLKEILMIFIERNI